MTLPREGSRTIREGIIVSEAMDWCRSPTAIVPYRIYAHHRVEGASTADSVRQTDERSHVQGSLIRQCYGDEPGVGGGVTSGTRGAECEPKTWSSSVRFEGRHAVRHDDAWWMNHKNTYGRLTYVKDATCHDTPQAKPITPRMQVAQAATGTMSDAVPLGTGAAAIPKPGLDAGAAAGGLVMQQLDRLREDNAVQGAARTLGLDLSRPADILASRAYVWGKNFAPTNYWDVPYSGPANDAVARSIANTELAHPGTLGGALDGNKDDQKRLDGAVKAGLAAAAATDAVRISRNEETKRILCHDTSAEGLAGILASQQIFPSLKAVNPADARYGDGQYFSDIVPGTKSNASLSAIFIRNRFQGRRFSHYVCIDTKDLNVIEGRKHVYVVPNGGPLNITGRIQSLEKINDVYACHL